MVWKNPGTWVRRMAVLARKRRADVAAVLVLSGPVAALVLARVYRLGVAATLVAAIIGLPALFVAWVRYSQRTELVP